MIVKNQRAELMAITPNAEKLIERVGRICTATVGRITSTSYVRFIENLLTPPSGGEAHKSVLEHANASFLIETSVAIAAQIRTHRFWKGDVVCHAHTQQSLRYCNLGSERFEGEIAVIKPCDLQANGIGFDAWLNSCAIAEKAYFRLLTEGNKPETARFILPESVATKFVVTANFSAWLTYLRSRTHKTAQIDHRFLAEKIAIELWRKCPNVFKEFAYLEV